MRSDPHVRELSFIVALYALFCFLSLTIFGILHITVEENPSLGHIELVGTTASLGVILLTRFTRYVAIARDVFLLTIVAMLIAMLATGGTAGTGAYWFFIFPVTAFLLTNKTLGLAWMVGLLVTVTAYVLLANAGVAPLFYSAIEIRQLLITLAIVGVGIYIYQRSRESLQTQSIQSKRDLQEEKIRADTILQNIDEGIVATDAEGTIVATNPAASSMLGWEQHEMLGKRFTTLVPLLDRRGRPFAEQDRPLTQTLQHDAHTVNTFAYQRKDGTSFPALIESRPITAKNATIGAINTFRDVTKEQAIDRAKTEFVTLASHQLRTPLSAIAWYGEMLLNNDVGKLTREQREYVEQIYKSNQRSAEMVDAMLTASSLELGDILTKPRQLDVAKVMHRVAGALEKKLAQGKGLHIIENYKEAPSTLVLDPDLTEHIITHLVSNALKYTPPKGEITLAVRTDSQRQQGVIIEVSDDGYGIPKRQQSKIFTKLFRAENIKKKDTDGTGLGLYIVHMAATYMGGTVTFNSEENKGTTFTVYLPAYTGGAHA